MDLKSPGTRGTYVDLVKTDLKYVGKKEMSTYFLRNIELLQKEVDSFIHSYIFANLLSYNKNLNYM